MRNFLLTSNKYVTFVYLICNLCVEITFFIHIQSNLIFKDNLKLYCILIEFKSNKKFQLFLSENIVNYFVIIKRK